MIGTDRTRAAALALAGFILSAGTNAPALAQEGPEALPEGPGREVVFYTCNACHSIRLVTQQRLSRQRWDRLLDWMVAEQGMAELAPEERTLVLDYLEAHYGVDAAR